MNYFHSSKPSQKLCFKQMFNQYILALKHSDLKIKCSFKGLINDVYLFGKYTSDIKMKRSFPVRFLSLSGIPLIVFLLVFHLSLMAQSQLRFEHINKKDGLSQGTVNAILQDNNGLMWFGTNDGLNRYDGKNMIIYRRNHADKTSSIDESKPD